MKLNKPIIIYPPADIKPDGNIVVRNPITLYVLDVTYIINPTNKNIYANIKPFPFKIPLVSNAEEYAALKNYTIQDLEEILHKLLGAEPEITLRSFYPKTLGENPDGIGTKLILYLRGIGLPIKYNYGAFYNHMLEMNTRGIQWCIENKQEILQWIESEMLKNNQNFIKPIIEKNLNRFLHI